MFGARQTIVSVLLAAVVAAQDGTLLFTPIFKDQLLTYSSNYCGRW
jgi:hypothetical protein